MGSQSYPTNRTHQSSQTLRDIDIFYLDTLRLPHSSTLVSPPPQFNNPFATSEPNPSYAFPFDDSLSPLTIQEPNLPLPPNNALLSQSLAIQKCHLCKGQKYNFTAYFHNKNYFSSPPHLIIRLIEDSYILRNTLQALLVTYVARGFESTDLELQNIKKRIRLWAESVDYLVNRVVDHASTSAGLELELKPLVEVKDWTKEMAAKILDHVTDQKKLEFPGGGWIVLVFDFRKLWEKVWQGYLKDERNAQLEMERAREGSNSLHQ